VNGALRVKLHDKHAALVSIGKHLGMFVDRVQIQERNQICSRRWAVIEVRGRKQRRPPERDARFYVPSLPTSR
jgi:hypothetical protein